MKLIRGEVGFGKCFFGSEDIRQKVGKFLGKVGGSDIAPDKDDSRLEIRRQGAAIALQTHPVPRKRGKPFLARSVFQAGTELGAEDKATSILEKLDQKRQFVFVGKGARPVFVELKILAKRLAKFVKG